jgi:hypothetical protein
MIRDVGVGQLVEELEQRGGRLPFEIGAFVALEACEGLMHESVKLEPDDVRVTLEGSVLVSDSAESAEPAEAARSLVSVLARLLVAAGPGVPPYLLQLVQDSTTGQTPRGLRDLHDAIEASLIPINRGASRRVLARLVRESDRPPAPAVSQVDAHELDAELDELLRDPAIRTLEPEQAQLPLQEPEEEEPITEQIRIPRGAREDSGAAADTGAAGDTGLKSFPPPVADHQPETVPVPPSEPALRGGSVPVPDLGAPAAAAVARQPRPVGEPITATIRKWQAEEEEDPAPAPASMSVPVSATVSVGDPREQLETPTESVFGTGSVAASESIPTPELLPRQSRPAVPPDQPYDRPSLPQQPPKRRGGWGIWLLAAGLGLGAYALHATGRLDSLLKPATPAPAVGGAINVSVTPPGAQIFVFIGRGPAMAKDLPVDAAHEFIVFDQGLRPSRAIVQKGAAWAATEAGPLYELAVQAQPAEPSVGSSELGVPQTEAGAIGEGPTGTVRVITNPPAAKVYRFVGVGPSAHIPVPSIHEGQELIVYHPGYETRRAVVGPSDWERVAGEDIHTATLAVQLPALPALVVAETPED